MRKKLALQGMIKLIVGIITLGLLLFLPAGTFHFPGAWRMLGILFVPMLILGMVLLIVKPELLAKRLNQKLDVPLHAAYRRLIFRADTDGFFAASFGKTDFE